MELSEKDASRSKWKLSQRHRQGRRGRGVPSAGRTSRLSKQLESNESRYVEPEADEHAGPVRKSQGADLAELLEGTDVIDVAFYQRARVNLVEDYGLPPSHGRTFQGLSFDLKGLAEALSLLPRGVLLDTDAYGPHRDAASPAAASAAAPAESAAAPGAASAQAPRGSSRAVVGGDSMIETQRVQPAPHATPHPPGRPNPKREPLTAGQLQFVLPAAGPTLDHSAQSSEEAALPQGGPGVSPSRRPHPVGDEHAATVARGSSPEAASLEPHGQLVDHQEAELDFLLGAKHAQQSGELAHEGGPVGPVLGGDPPGNRLHSLAEQQQHHGVHRQGRGQEEGGRLAKQAQQGELPDAELDFLLSLGGNPSGGVGVPQDSMAVQNTVLHPASAAVSGGASMHGMADVNSGVVRAVHGPPSGGHPGQVASLDDWLDSL